MNDVTLLAIPRFAGSKFGGIHNNILSLATYLIYRGHDTYVIDLNNPDLCLADFTRLLNAIQPSIVGITSTSPSHLSACELARIVKQHSKDVLVVKGGKHDTFAWKTTLQNHPEIDIVVRGEGEVILEELVNHVKQGHDYRNVRGIAYRSCDQIKVNSDNAEVNFQALPFPDRSLIAHHSYYDFDIFGGKKTAQVMTTRGCPYTCNFCHVGQRYKVRSAQQVLAELHYLQGLGYTAVYFDDGTFIANRQRVMDISRGMIEQGIHLEWGCQTRVDRVDAETLRWMREAGCTYIFYGIEAADQDILDRLNKRATAAQARNAIGLTKASDIRTAVSLMIGTPYEDNAQLIRSFEFANELKPDFISLSLYALYPPSVDASYYESDQDHDPRLLRFDEGYGSRHHVDGDRADEIYHLAMEILGHRII